MDDLKKRKTTRLNGADYNRNQAVFLTICTKERQCILSRIVGTGVLDCPSETGVLDCPSVTGVLDGPQIELTKYGQIADKYIRQLNDFYDDLSVESYVIMPNHIHIMLWVKGAGKRTVEDAGPYSAEFRSVAIIGIKPCFSRYARKKGAAFFLVL